MNDVIERDLVLSQPVERVWRALTDPKELASWFPDRVELDVRPGGQGTFAFGVEGGEGSFSLCSFWYVEALTHVGRLDDARLALEKMFTYANHVGLYAEQIGFTGEQLGNFPQALTHLSLISAATNLDRALSG